MKKSMEAFKAALKAGQAVKMIAGIANLDLDSVKAVAQATEASHAHALDVAAYAEVIQAAKSVTSAVIFASHVEPAALAAAAGHGADVVELGNFDALYEQGLFLSASDILKLAEETKALVQTRALISITVPGHLALDSQIQLASALEAMGIDLLQTEGAARIVSQTPSVKTLDAHEKAALALRNTRALTAAVGIPVICASGMTAENVALAFEAGAAAVGIGSYVNKATTVAEMTERAHQVMNNRTRVLSQVG